MIINHNMNAMNAHRNMMGNTSRAGRSMEKLSSGLRINRAGDDAAGLAISEKMRGQIRGLDQASRNANDGISMIQTAEGALNETHSILQRMRELAVQGANDTISDSDRGQIQKEMDQLTSEIDRIGNTTEFNTKKLINGGANVSGSLGASISASSIKIVGGTGDTKVGETVTISGGAAAIVKATSATDTRAGMFTAGAVAGAAETLTINGTKFTFDIGTTTENVIKTLNDAGLGITATATATDLTLTTAAEGSAAALVSDIDTEGTIATVRGADASVKLTGGIQYSAQGNTITIESGTAKGLQLEVLADQASVTAAGGDITVDSNGTLSLQIGANENQSMNIGIGDMRSGALGVDGIKVSDPAAATASISTIQSAIDTVSTERSKLGAYQNRLEHTIANLNTSSENMQASESRIRDVDMAKEMLNFSKENILQQAAQAMLAQAKQAPQGVLQLLR